MAGMMVVMSGNNIHGSTFFPRNGEYKYSLGADGADGAPTMRNHLRGVAFLTALAAAAGAQLIAAPHGAPSPELRLGPRLQAPPCGGGIGVSNQGSWRQWKERFAAAVDDRLRTNRVRRSREGALVEFVLDNQGVIISLDARSGIPNRKPTAFVDQMAEAVRAVASSLPFPEARPQIVQLQLRADDQRVFTGAHSQKILPCPESVRPSSTAARAQNEHPAFQRARQMGLAVFPGAVPVEGNSGGTDRNQEFNIEASSARFETPAPVSEVLSFYRSRHPDFHAGPDGLSATKIGKDAVIFLYRITISRSNEKTVIQMSRTTV